mmetsp:Transcript_2026/g.4790  ORF Transcript_2026/g.4790 Transcript_2026/m.4790 type:complete len:471 (-) Transcript_2026:725-2137(-)
MRVGRPEPDLHSLLLLLRLCSVTWKDFSRSIGLVAGLAAFRQTQGEELPVVVKGIIVFHLESRRLSEALSLRRVLSRSPLPRRIVIARRLRIRVLKRRIPIAGARLAVTVASGVTPRHVPGAALASLLQEPELGSCEQAKRLTELLDLDVLHIKYRLVGGQEDAPQVADQRPLGNLLQLRALGHQRLDGGRGGLELVRVDSDRREADIRILELLHHRLLPRGEVQERVPRRGEPRRAPDAVDVLRDVLRAVHLEHPFHRREVEAARGNVCCEKDHLLGLAELVKHRHAPRLLHLPVEHPQGDARSEPLEDLKHKLHLLAGGKEAYRLAQQVAPHKAPKHVELLVGLAIGDGLPQLEGGRRDRLSVDGDVLGVAEAEPREVLHRACLRRGEEHRLLPVAEVLEDRVERPGKPHVEDPVGLVQNEHLKVAAVEPRRLVHVLKQAPGRSHEDVHAVDKFLLVFDTLPTNQQAS